MFSRKKTDDEKFSIIEQFLGELYSEMRQVAEWQRRASPKNINQRFELVKRVEKIAIKIEKIMKKFRHEPVQAEKREEFELVKRVKRILVSLNLQRKKYNPDRYQKEFKRIEVV